MSERDIVREYVESRRSGNRPYFHRGPAKGYDFHRPGRHTFLMESRDFDGPNRLFTTAKSHYLIASDSNSGGLKEMPDRMILPWKNSEQLRFWKNFCTCLNQGQVNFDYFKFGRYGAVGFNPEFNKQKHEHLCVKFFNLALPFTQEAWESYLKEKKNSESNYQKWRLSAVTGIGSYLSYHLLRAAGLPTPDAYFATNDLFIQEFIDGYTITELIDLYPKLVEEGILNEDIINGIWDWLDNNLQSIQKKVQETIDPTIGTHWSPDFNRYDVVWGNIMIRKNGLTDPANNFVLIDPLA